MMKTLVTGAAGFTGGHLVERLLRDGHEVVAVDLPSAALDGLAKTCSAARGLDLGSGEGLAGCMAGVETVFHVAAFAAPWGAPEKFWRVNVTGTENVIKAAKAAGVRRLVHVSSTSAVFDGYTPHDRIDESFAYPDRFISPYSSSKSVAERLVLSANSSGLETVAIRPHLIWGPRDQTFLKRLLDKAGSWPVLHIGGGRTMTDTTYVDNLVEGLVLAATSPRAPGQAYFIMNDEPMMYRAFIDKYLELFELPPARGSLPTAIAYAIGSASDAIWTWFKLSGEPLLSRYALAELTVTHTYNLDAARRDLGYRPIVTCREGFERVKSWAIEAGMVPGR